MSTQEMTSPRLSSDAVARWLIVASIALGAGLRIANVSNLATRTPDEGVYTAQAQRVLHQGLSGIRGLADEYVHDASQRFYPPPSRLGYMSLTAAAMAWTGRSDAVAGAWVSTLASLTCLALVASIGVTFLNPWAGAVATFLLAVFPPDLVIARRAWSDAWVSCLTCMVLLSALWLARGRAPRFVLLAFLGAGGAFVLTKETALVVWGLGVAWVVVRQRRAAIPIVAGVAATGLLSLGVLFWAIGGPSVFMDIQAGLPVAHATNPYALDFQNGPPYWLLKTFWIASPWTFSLALLGLVTAPFGGPWRDRLSVVALAGFALAFLALPFGVPNWLNLRYASPAFGPLCLLAAAALGLAFERLENLLPPLGMAAATALACVGLGLVALNDYRYFHRWFVETETADLAARMVFATKGYSVGSLPNTTPAAAGAAEAYLSQSIQLFQQKRFEESIAAARQALGLRPDYAVAYNNIAAAYEEMGQWDDAIRAAEEAIRLDPGFALARNNLAWARAQKAKANAGSSQK
jgi:4-amino-4-deoxy-L-arabinose transferase-like glycosyltransferase